LAFVDIGVIYTGVLRLWVVAMFGVDFRLMSSTACKIHMHLTYLLRQVFLTSISLLSSLYTHTGKLYIKVNLRRRESIVLELDNKASNSLALTVAQGPQTIKLQIKNILKHFPSSILSLRLI